MFACPHCAQALQQQRGPQGVVWSCPACRGHAASLGVLRKVFGPERVATIWGESCRDEVERGCACPVCQGSTARVTWLEQGRPLVVDLCRRCEFVWFDPGEYESLAPAPPPPPPLGQIDETALPPEAREALAMERVRELARQEYTSDGPPSEWKSLPALFGFPVEVDDLPAPRAPVATYALGAAIAVVSFWAFYAVFGLHQAVVERFGLVPAHWTRSGGLTLVTSFFLHGSLMHLVGNLYFLVVFGRHVEEYIGSWRWLLLVAVAALLGDFVDIALTSDSTVPLIGASGGISGLLAFYALKFPHARLGLLVFYRWVNIPSWGAFALWIAFQLWGAYQQLEHVGNVASLAHLGGVVAGLAFWLPWRNLDSKPAPGAISPFPAVTVR